MNDIKNAILVTGGAGFIGSNFVLEWLQHQTSPIINLDRLTYASNPNNVSAASADRHRLVKGDINDRELVRHLLRIHEPAAIVHFAAESHVDRSILGPEEFVRTNVLGTFSLLEEAKQYWNSLSPASKNSFRFLHVSTDEVYGSLSPSDPPFSETTPYSPNSPYSASKAVSDHLVRAYNHTYGFPTLITNCSNNYGPRQFPEKLIPLTIVNALNEKPLPVYGNGRNIRDWLYVTDHCRALRAVLAAGKPGETYNIGGRNELENISVVRTICQILDELLGRHPGNTEQLIQFVGDRPGHDLRYAINANKITNELHWQPAETFATGIRKTVHWYLDNPEWIAEVKQDRAA